MTARLEFVVGQADTARALGSGDVEVLGTPRLLAWCEAATVAAAAGLLEPGQTSVGTRVSLEHLAPTPVGVRVQVEASLLNRDGRLLVLTVAAHEMDDAGPATLIGTGEVRRVIVDAARFAERAAVRQP